MTAWSRQELLQLSGIIVAGIASIIGIIVAKMVKTIHVIINSRLTQLISLTDAASRAEGEAKGRADEEAREVKRKEET